ncbi:LacI family DNA-binding transcriptional regulator [Fictibacillus phosphorivorans]|uniref:LacI family DNA-binding transcriptional regulator n=1 Tax=Fictibacillus phosphorivorans TaxID=1221500 RepID=UPI000A82B732
MANIRDIARLAGVSVTTVSRVINNQPYVSAEKVSAVKEAMKKYNYHRNINAVHLSRGKTHLIGVVIPFSNHPYFGLLIEGIANAALDHNYKVVLIQTNYEKAKEMEALKMLEDKQIDALIICSRISSWDVIESYLAHGPIILCEDSRNEKISSTFIDHYKAFTLALDYLYEKGHRQIGYSIGRQTGTNSTQRERAYKDFLSKHSLPFEINHIFTDRFHVEDGVDVVESLLKMQHRPTALLVTSDQVAAGIVTSIRERGLSVPKDLAIMSFDNQPISKVMHITTLEIPLVVTGKKLFQQALTVKKLHMKKSTSV